MRKASLPAGFRDFSPEEHSRRKTIFNIIENAFTKFNFRPIETPAIESAATLTEKYGEEGNKLLYRILNSGNFLQKVPGDALHRKDPKQLLPLLSDKGLRYDLTVPFARYVAMHQNDIAFPFKRYQMQPVWRADRPQKGRYREFYQCDADVVGSKSVIYEAEFLQVFDEVFRNLGFDKVEVKINNRKILMGIAEIAGIEKQFTGFTVALDKMDKAGREGVEEELKSRNIDPAVLASLDPLLKKDNKHISALLNELDKYLENSKTGKDGVMEMRKIFELLENQTLNNTGVTPDILLARGLDYYTGTVFEALPPGKGGGSIAGGGRYDKLTSYFGLPGVSGVGISFGIERIFDLMNEQGLFSESGQANIAVLIINFGEDLEKMAYDLLNRLRNEEIPAELHPGDKKLKKQFAYADKRKIPFTLIAGREEIQSGKLRLKDMTSGEQQVLTEQEVINKLKFISHLKEQ